MASYKLLTEGSLNLELRIMCSNISHRKIDKSLGSNKNNKIRNRLVFSG